MRIFLTGATGFVGAAVLRRLLADGEEVRALARSDESMAAVSRAGAHPVRGTLADSAVIAAELRSAAGVIHTAADRGQLAASSDAAFVRTVVDVLSGSGVPYVHSSGAWIYGPGQRLRDDSVLAPPDITSWRKRVEETLLASDVTSTIVVPGLVHDDQGRGVLELLRPSPERLVHMVGDGTQHWTTVHVEDLADLYVRCLWDGPRRARVMGVTASHRVLELATAAAGQTARAVAEAVSHSRERLGAELADALLMDQEIGEPAQARSLGWTPIHTNALDAAAQLGIRRQVEAGPSANTD